MEELSGNVWEWTGSVWRVNYRPGTNADRDLRVVRGGGFDGGPSGLRSACRYHAPPADRGGYDGFRVVASPFD